MELTIPVVMWAAALDSLNPCAFSILLLTISFLFSVKRERKEILKIGGAYILAIFAVYAAIGLGILRALSWFGIPHTLGKVGAVILLVVGLYQIAQVLFSKLPQFGISQKIHGRLAILISKASVLTALGVGAIVALYEFPCTGGPYLAILSLLHDSASFWSGLGYLLFYNLIFILPLVIILYVASIPVWHQIVEEWKKKNMRMAKAGVGFLMILLAVILLLVQAA